MNATAAHPSGRASAPAAPPPSLAAAAPEAIVRTDALVRSFRGRHVVNGVAVHVGPAEVVALLGPNGAGKTTLFRMVAGLLRPDSGRVFIGGTDVTALPLHGRARLGLGYLPQESSVFRGLTVEENLLAVMEVSGVPRAERRPRADALLTEFRLTALRGATASTLSGGERRRTEVARALATRPAVLLMDEPFAGMDPRAVEELGQLVHALRGRGLGVLITDHQVREALSVCDRAYVIDHGVIIDAGPPTAIAESARARAAYLGDAFRL